MKKIYSTFLALCVATIGSAQVTLTKVNNEPVIGDMEMNSIFDTTSTLNNSTGTNQNWNFSSLTTTTLTEMQTYTTVASAPNGTNFPTATIASTKGPNDYTYFKATASQYELVGIDAPNLAINFTNTAVFVVWPVSYGYTNSDSFSGPAMSGTITGVANGSLTTSGSGTGTLTLPGGLVFNNVLQMKTQQDLNLSFMSGLITATLNTVSYNYYTSSQKFAVMSVDYQKTNGFTTDTTATVKINQNVLTSLNEKSSSFNFVMFPNPASNQLNFIIQNQHQQNVAVEIINLYGQSIKQIELGNDIQVEEKLSIDDLSNGVYFVKTTIGENHSIKKFIKQ